MRIVHIVPSYYPYESGGSAYSLFRLNCGLSSYKKIIVSEGLRKNGERKNCVTHDKNHKAFFFSKFSYKMYATLFKVCRKADCIQLSSFFFPPNLFAFIIAKVFNRKMIISPRGEFFEYALNRKRKQKGFFINLFKFINPKTIFHATSEKEIEMIKKLIPSVKNENIVKIFNSFESEYSLSEKRKNQFLFLGRINPIKNIHSVFKYIKNIEDVTFLIAGEANLSYEKEYLNFLKLKIKQLGIENKVKFLGKVHGEEKYKVIASCKCLVLPSHSENFGNVVLESLSQGTPVIASLGTPWSLLDEYACGFHIDFNLEEVVQLKLTSLISLDQVDFTRIKENTKNLMEMYQTTIINDKWKCLYEREFNSNITKINK